MLKPSLTKFSISSLVKYLFRLFAPVPTDPVKYLPTTLKSIDFKYFICSSDNCVEVSQAIESLLVFPALDNNPLITVISAVAEYEGNFMNFLNEITSSPRLLEKTPLKSPDL